MRFLIVLGLAGCGSTDFNNCKTFTDRSAANADRTIYFGGTYGNTYSPACMTVAAGQTVIFDGDFQTYSLQPGTPGDAQAGGQPNPATDDFAAGTVTGPLLYQTSGDYPFYCKGYPGMMGQIRVK